MVARQFRLQTRRIGVKHHALPRHALHPTRTHGTVLRYRREVNVPFLLSTTESHTTRARRNGVMTTMWWAFALSVPMQMGQAGKKQQKKKPSGAAVIAQQLNHQGQHHQCAKIRLTTALRFLGVVPLYLCVPFAQRHVDCVVTRPPLAPPPLPLLTLLALLHGGSQ